MGETNSKLTYGDPSSAKQVLEVVDSIFKLKINLKKIDESAKKIEKSFSEISKNLEEISQKQEGPSTQSNYIR
jgi:predicted ATP-grasp superfamily ATP-dependent carboligase